MTITILVRTVDTDVVVLAVMAAETLLADNEVWIAFGTGKHLRYLAAHQMVACQSHLPFLCFMH